MICYVPTNDICSGVWSKSKYWKWDQTCKRNTWKNGKPPEGTWLCFKMFIDKMSVGSLTLLQCGSLFCLAKEWFELFSHCDWLRFLVGGPQVAVIKPTPDAAEMDWKMPIDCYRTFSLKPSWRSEAWHEICWGHAVHHSCWLKHRVQQERDGRTMISKWLILRIGAVCHRMCSNHWLYGQGTKDWPTSGRKGRLRTRSQISWVMMSRSKKGWLLMFFLSNSKGHRKYNMKVQRK